MANFYIPKKKVKKTGKQQALTIEKLDQKFQGLGYIDNKVVFVAGALPGEQVLMQITRNQKKYASAKLIDVLEPAPQRIEPTCQHYSQCGGCQTQFADNNYQLELKQQGLANRMRLIAPQAQWLSALESPAWNYRRRARVGVKVVRGQLVLGFRQHGSNDLTSISHCPVLTAPFDKMFTPLQELVQSLSVTDKVGHLEFIAVDSGNYIIIRLLCALGGEDRQLLTSFSETHDVEFLIADNDGNVKTPEGSLPLPLFYTLADKKIEFSATDFIQVNDSVNQQMVAQAVQWLELTSSDKVLDLFCGVGNFSLSIAAQAQLVVGVEGVNAMVEQARANAQAAGLDNITFHHSDLSEPLAEQAWYSRKLGEQVDKILLDPARDGAMAIVEQLSKLKPSIIVYVSCEPSSLERDSQVIIKQGYKLEKICVMDMFPQTTHLESMALFRKC
jgi:23S rRNA (uracil1939-C5)-methyltransferase